MQPDISFWMLEDEQKELNKDKSMIRTNFEPPENSFVFIDAKVKNSHGSNEIKASEEDRTSSIDIIQDELTQHDFNTDQSLMIPISSSIDHKMLTTNDM